MLGTKELNKSLQEVLNHATEKKKERNTGNTIYRVGDRIMQVKKTTMIFTGKDALETKQELVCLMESLERF